MKVRLCRNDITPSIHLLIHPSPLHSVTLSSQYDLSSAYKLANYWCMAQHVFGRFNGSIFWQKLQKSDVWCAVGFAIAALVLYWFNLGQAALRDWDEGTIAQVAKEMYQSSDWLFPTLYGAPYLNKPPLVEWLINIGYSLGGVQTWTARLVPAAVSALAVPLLFLLGRQLFGQKAFALCSAGVYLTLLPVARHGRLAMRDGVAITLFLALLYCLLQARHDRRWGLGVGLALGLIGLTKGLLALLLGAVAGIFLLVNRQWSLLKSPLAWAGFVLGLVPAIAWYALQFQHYGATFWQGHVMGQSLDRIWAAVDNHQEPFWFYGVELLEYGWPWLLFWPSSLWLAWKSRSQPWAQLVLVGTVVYLGTISVMDTKLPWYIMPLYPFVALAIGAQLGEIWVNRRPFYQVWTWLLGAIAVISLIGGFVAGWLEQQWLLMPIGLVLAGTLGSAAGLVKKCDRNFIPVLISGLYVALLIFISSDFWLWELNEAFPVQPVAAMLKEHTPAQSKILTTFPYHRPSLDFYSNRYVRPAGSRALRRFWRPDQYFLVPADDQSRLPQPTYWIVDEAAGLLLVQPMATDSPAAEPISQAQ